MNSKQIAGIVIAALSGGFLGWYITWNYNLSRWYQPMTDEEIALLANTPWRSQLQLTLRPRYAGAR